MGNLKNHECKSLRGRFRRISKSQKHPRETEREEVRSGGDSSRGTEGKELPVNTKPPSSENISAPGGPPPSTEPVQSGLVSKE